MKQFILAVSVVLNLGSAFAGNNSNSAEDRAKELMRTPQVFFEENLGQVGDMEGKQVTNVLFRAKAKGVEIYLTTEGISYVFRKIEVKEGGEEPGWEGKEKEEEENSIVHWSRLDMQLEGAAISSKQVKKFYPADSYNNYYLSHCPLGITHVRSYGKVLIENIYPGIDWEWIVSKEGKMKHEFVVHPGANPKQIQWHYQWEKEVRINDLGELVLKAPVGEVTEGKPYCYELTSGHDVSGKYQYVSGKRSMHYDLAEYNTAETLIIDPTLNLIWGTYYGGDQYDGFNGVGTDAAGNISISAYVNSSNFPTKDPGGSAWFQGTNAAVGIYDICLVQFSNTGSLKWATYYGGSSSDSPTALAVDASGNAFVTGFTVSPDLPMQSMSGAYYQGTAAGANDFFILKFDLSGVRQWATYYGGSGNDMGGSIMVDPLNNDLIVTGTSYSTDFPTLNPGGTAWFQGTNGGGDDVVLVKFNSFGVPLWSTYYGGSSTDEANSLSTDVNGNLFVSGYTASPNFPTKNPGGGSWFQGVYGGGIYDVFILKFSSTNAQLWGSYYGGNAWDAAGAIAVSNAGNGDLFVTGQTASPNFPTKNPGGSTWFQGTYGGGAYDAFVLQFSNAGVRKWGTFYGESGYDVAHCVIADPVGDIFVTGRTTSSNLSTYNPGTGFYNGTYAGVQDAFLLQFDKAGVRKWATFSGTPSGDFGFALNVNFQGCLILIGEWWGGGSNSLKDPGGNAYYDAAYDAIHDGYIMKLCPDCIVNVSVVPAASSLCLGDTAILTASGGTTYSWSTGDTTSSITVIPSSPSSYFVIVSNGPCSDTAQVSVNVYSISVNAGADTTITEGDKVLLHPVSGAAGSYSWQPSDGVSCDTCKNPMVTPAVTTTYIVTVTDSNGCIAVDTITIYVEKKCGELFVPNAFSPNGDGQNEVFLVMGNKNCIEQFMFSIYNRWGEKVFETDDITKGWNGAYKGTLSFPAVFSYHLTAKFNGKEVVQRGNINLIR